MPDSTVQQAGGDFTTLAAALADPGTVNGDTITIQAAWTIDDTAAATVSDTDITIQIDSSNPSYHNGVYSEANDHYRLVVGGNHCLTINQDGCVVDGPALVQDGAGASDETIRCAASTGIHIIQNCLLRATTATVDQDAVHLGNIAGTVRITNTIMEGFGRAALAGQITAGIKTQNWEVNSCTIWNCQTVEDVEGGGISIFRGANKTYNMDIFNTIVLDCNTPSADDYSEFGAGGAATWNIDNSIDSDGSISGLDAGAVDPLENRTATDVESPGVVDFVIFQNITTTPFNLLLQFNADDNDAQDAHSNTTGAGLTLPTLDITAETRDTDPGSIDIGADEAEPPPVIVPLPEYGQVRSAIGDPSVYGAVIVRS